MKRTKSGLALLLVLCMVMGLLPGCVKESSSSDQSKPVSRVSQQEEGIALTDQAGRTVALDHPAQRIVSVYGLSSSLLIALGVQDRVVGIEERAETREIYRRAAPAFLELPAVDSGREVNVEETAALEPDLVILPLKLADSVPRLEALNIPCLVIDPETMEGFLEAVQLVGAAVGAEDRAKQLATYHRDVMEDVGERCAVAEERPTVYLAGPDFLWTAGGGMYQDDLITTAGGTNVAAQLEGDRWTGISLEQLVDWDPQRIFMVSYGGYGENDVVNNPRFAQLTALQNGALYTFPSSLEPWDYPTPSSVLGIYWLAAQLHPDLVSPEEYVAAAEDFYQTYYGISVTEEDLMVKSLLRQVA